MKAQTKAAVASVAVIALALTAVSGVTYSWWTDSESTEIGITTGSFSLEEGSYSLSYPDGLSSKNVSLTRSSGSGTGPSSSTVDLSFAVDPPRSDTDIERVYTLTYTTKYESSAPVTIMVAASVAGGDGWISDVKATSLSSGSTDVGPATGHMSTHSISADLGPSAVAEEVSVTIQFTVNLDLAVNKAPATLKVDTQLTSRAA